MASPARRRRGPQNSPESSPPSQSPTSNTSSVWDEGVAQTDVGLPILCIESSDDASVTAEVGGRLASVAEQYLERVEGEECGDLKLVEEMGGTQGIINLLKTCSHRGLSEDSQELESRSRRMGNNILPARSPTPFWQLLWVASSDLVLRILMVAGMVSLTLGLTFGKRKDIEWIEGAAIFLAVLIVVFVTAANDWMKERQFAKLSAVKALKNCTVIRSGGPTQIYTTELLVGDLIQLEIGEEVPADCVASSSHNLAVDESCLTGESRSLTKYEFERCKGHSTFNTATENIANIPSPIVLAGSTVVSGEAKLVVIAVGVQSQIGQIYQKLSFDPEPTPLQKKLNSLARDIGKAGFFAALLTFAVLQIGYWVMWTMSAPESRPSGADVAADMLDFVVEGITILVVAVPEGLPLAVTIALAYSIGLMLEDQNYVRRLAACETMGGANEICSDKTGTLTANVMTVEAVWNGTVCSTVSPLPRVPANIEQMLVDALSVNSTAFLEKETVDNKSLVPGKRGIRRVGSATECGLLEYIQGLGYDYHMIRHVKYGGAQVLCRIPFTSETKRMTTVVASPENPSKNLVFVKGAPEEILQMCDFSIDEEGNKKRLDSIQRKEIEKTALYTMTSKALRTMCVAYGELDALEGDGPEMVQQNSAGKDAAKSARIEQNLVCLAIFGLDDPVRPEVPNAVRSCQKAGIRVRMVTGDNLETAKQVAVRCNILQPDSSGLCMTGKEFFRQVGGVVCERCRTEKCGCPLAEGQSKNGIPMRKDVVADIESFRQIAANLDVLARSQPLDKYTLVTGLRQLGSVVAVTGDGINDAPALKKADVGFAMGASGTEIAKAAADIILLDDNFESIVKAVKWGRCIYDNIRKFLQFQLTVNIVAVATAFVSAFVLRASALTAVQLLWVNLIMDTLASLALATEPPTDHLLERMPHQRNEYLISKTMWRNMIGHSCYQLIVTMTIIFTGDCWLPEKDWTYVTDDLIAANPGFSMYSQRCGREDFVRSGRRFKPFSQEEDYKGLWEVTIGPSRHYTIVFNTFVWMQIFNMLAARKIQGEWKVFSGIFKNKIWMGVVSLIVVGQTLIVQYGGYVSSCHLDGLTTTQWVICVGFGAGSLVANVVIQLIPEAHLPQFGRDEVNPVGEEMSVALATRGRSYSGRLLTRISSGVDRLTRRDREAVQNALPLGPKLNGGGGAIEMQNHGDMPID
eukprot:GHVN01001070.1.p1 GENE.GHVN01001070.1~~GHVN01001070.1.p1  ORF type:complete len:1202 (-),score=114.93 GHVN01001070.1:1704-5309(-)